MIKVEIEIDKDILQRNDLKEVRYFANTIKVPRSVEYLAWDDFFNLKGYNLYPVEIDGGFLPDAEDVNAVDIGRVKLGGGVFILSCESCRFVGGENQVERELEEEACEGWD